MFHFLPAPVRSCFSLLGYCLNSLFWVSLLMITALLRALIPIKKWQRMCGRMAGGIAESWMEKSTRSKSGSTPYRSTRIWSVTMPAIGPLGADFNAGSTGCGKKKSDALKGCSTAEKLGLYERSHLKTRWTRSNRILHIFVLLPCNRPLRKNLYFPDIEIFYDIFPPTVRCLLRNSGCCSWTLLSNQTRLQNINTPCNRKTAVEKGKERHHFELTESDGESKKRTGIDQRGDGAGITNPTLK